MSDITAIEDVPAAAPIPEEPIEEVEAAVEEILEQPEVPTEETELPSEEVEAIVEEALGESDLPTEEIAPPVDEPEVPIEAPVEEPVLSDPPAELASEEAEKLPPTDEPSVEQIAEAVAAQNPDAAALLETEQAIEREIAAPEAPTVPTATIPEPLPNQKVNAPDVGTDTGPVDKLKQASEDAKEKVKKATDDAVATSLPGPTPPALTNVAPLPGTPSVVSKRSRKIRVIKAAVGRKVLPKTLPRVLHVGVPKEAVPLVQLLRQKKKKGEDIGNLVNVCMVALGT